MGTYTGSPWGNIRGKIDDAVGGIWKGIDWVRVRVLPTQLGTITKYRLWKEDPTNPFSFKQFNIRRLVTQVLGYVARSNSNIVDWIRPIWDALVEKRGYTMTGTNAFVKRNAAILFASMTDENAEYEPTSNTPDLLEMLVSDGDLEPVASITTCAYDPLTGSVDVVFNSETFTNGQPTDSVCCIIMKKPLLQMEDEPDMTLWNWRPQLFAYIFIPADPPAERSDGSFTVALPKDLDPTQLTLYMFLHDDAIGYSPSKSSVFGA